MLGVAVTATWALTRVPPRQHRLATAVTVAVLVALGVRSFVQMPTWRTTTTLFEHVLAVNPRSFAACDQLGHVDVVLARRIAGQRAAVPPGDLRYAEWRRDLEGSLVWYRRALDRFDGYVPALVNIATDAGRLGRHDEQRQALRRVYDLQPTVPVGLRADPVELANRMLAAGDPAAAERVLDEVLRAEPTNVTAMVLRSRAVATRSN